MTGLRMMSSARAMCHTSQAIEFRSSRGRTFIWSALSPPSVRSAADPGLPPTSFEWTAPCCIRKRSRTSMGIAPSVGCGNLRVTGRGIGDRVVVVGRHGAADADGTDDVSAVDDRHAAASEHEPIVAEGGDVVGEQHALGETLLQVERRGLECGGRVRLRACDLRRHPERAVHALARDQMPGVVDDRDGDEKAELLRLLDPALDTDARLLEGDGTHASVTNTSSPSMRTGYEATAVPRGGNRHCPVFTSYIQPCQGHASRV